MTKWDTIGKDQQFGSDEWIEYSVVGFYTTIQDESIEDLYVIKIVVSSYL